MSPLLICSIDFHKLVADHCPKQEGHISHLSVREIEDTYKSAGLLTPFFGPPEANIFSYAGSISACEKGGLWQQALEYYYHYH